MLRATLLMCMALGTAAFAQSTGKNPEPVAKGEQMRKAESDVLAAQVMLDRTGFSPGEIDGRSGANFQRTLAAFQGSRDLQVSGRMDEPTAKQLMQEMGEQPLVITYTLTDADVAGPFQPEIPKDLVEQSTLPALSYRNPLEAIAEKFHASPALLQSLNAGQTFERAGDQIIVPNVLDTALSAPESPSRATIIVTKRTSALTVEDQDGRVVFHAPVTTGSKHDPLPIGKWKITGVAAVAGLQLQPRPVLGRQPFALQGAHPRGTEQSGRCCLDRPQQGALRDPWHARTVDDRSYAVARLRAHDELGRPSSARMGEARDIGDLPMTRLGRAKHLQRLALIIAVSFTMGVLTT